ncbi:MAG: orotidine-5'-phosphate decarboxylase [Planctomycetota bacterium]
MSWADRLHEAVHRVGNPCMVGLDPHLDLLPDEFAVARDPQAPRRDRAQALSDFCWEMLDLCAGTVAVVKPQSAFFELFGADGVEAWETVVTRAHEAGLLVLGDVKRGDIASTAKAYATAFLQGVPGTDPAPLCDAVTVNPYLGDDAVEPFLEACRESGTGIYVLVRTSNAGGTRFQLHGEPALSHLVADAVSRWGEGLMGECGFSSVGAVVGATHADELADFRARMPHTPFLLPGFGAQGASAHDTLGAFSRGGLGGALIASSRGVSFAYRSERYAGKSWKDAAAASLHDMIAEVTSALATVQAGG